MANLQDTTNKKKHNTEDVRQQMLVQLDASKKAISELNEEELESIVGGHGNHGGSGTGGGSIDQTGNNNWNQNNSKSNSQSIADINNMMVSF